MNANQYKPDWNSCPGETISDILCDRNITTVQFAKAIGIEEMTAWGLFCGATLIDEIMAQKLEGFTGASRQFWLNRERLYRDSITKTGDRTP